MESLTRISTRLISRSLPPILHFTKPSIPVGPYPFTQTRFCSSKVSTRPRSRPRLAPPQAGWLMGFGKQKQTLPDIIQAGDPVLHEPAQEVDPDEVGSDKIQKMIDDMISVMRLAPGVGLAAPQIGIPLRIIVLEDTKEYIGFAPKEEIKSQDRRPFDLLVLVNPVLKKKGNRTALFFEGCLSVDGYRAVVERYFEVEVTGLDRYGQPIKVDASGWQARIQNYLLRSAAPSLGFGRLGTRKIKPRQNSVHNRSFG